jgi:uridylate kinase
MPEPIVISLGGSLIAPDGVDVGFLSGFLRLAVAHLMEDAGHRLIVVCGGGALARRYQAACREVAAAASGDDLDWVGVAATRVNAELVRRVFGRWCVEDVVTDPTAVPLFAGRVMVAAGWKPGFSTDYDAVVLAQRFSAPTVVNLSNQPRVFTADPRKDPTARPLDRLSWAEFRAIIGTKWSPGSNTIFDPVAAEQASTSGIGVIVADGRNVANLARILKGQSFEGTTIGPA